jgi:glycerol kinase
LSVGQNTMSIILALDQGTTSSRAILFDHAGTIRGVAQKEFQQFYPQAGWVEHDPMEILDSQLAVARQVLVENGISSRDIAAIGITNQRETTIVWDRKTGKPISPAIVWQDRRTADICDQLRNAGLADTIQNKSGLIVDAYFSGTKIRWMLDHVPGARQSAENGELAFGTVDSWLVWHLTAGNAHVTDPSNASRTMLYNLATGDWDDELLALLQVPRAMLPSVRPSSSVFAETAPGVFDTQVPIAGIAGDQQAALFGQNCVRHGMVKNTYGTGCFMLMNVGTEVPVSKHKLISTVAWQVDANTPRDFALEGSVFVAGAAVQWLRDGLGIIQSSNEIEALAATVPDNGGVTFVPALTGLGAPHWDAYARGTIQGLTRGTTKGHLARAALEGIAFQVADVLDAMRQDSGIAIDELRCDGGAAVNNLLMQFQADILQAPVVRPKVIETTALGAAFLAGLAVGFWVDQKQLASIWQSDRRFEPKMPISQVQIARERWSEAVQRSRQWIKPS